jgi:molybdate transport system regulatory protein
MKIKVKLIITNDQDESFMGVGLIWLLQAIKECKSINSAAKSMNMSYAKAIKLLNNLEHNLGDKVIDRRRGGNERCGAELTSYGESLIKKYLALQKKVNRAADAEFVNFLKTM